MASLPVTLRVVRDEHGSLSAMLRCLVLMLSEARRRGRLPDVALLRAMLFYLDEFSERVHHAKETELLFPAIRRRSREAADTLDRLDRDHARSRDAVRELEHGLLGVEMMRDVTEGGARFDRFEQALLDYVARMLEHLELEEAEILPLAERVLVPADWSALDAAFQAHRDPLGGDEPAAAYRPLYQRIRAALDDPTGLGSAMEALRRSYRRPAPDSAIDSS
jgi:hemerythrin-like domain-containing protein